MHALTKVLVLIASVLSIFLSAMVIAYAANTDRIQADYANAQTEKQVAVANLNAGQAQWAAEQSRLARSLDDLKGDLANKDQKVSGLELERANLISEKSKAEISRDSLESKIKQFEETIRTQLALQQNYSDEVTHLRKSELTFRQQKLDLEQRLADVESQRDVLNANNRALQEQLVEARHAMGKTGETGPGIAAGAMKGPYLSTQFISGRVEEVQRDTSSGKTLVKLSVGSNSGVSKNMIFYAIRGNDWVANLLVVQTDLRFSVAEVSLTSSTAGEVKVDDAIVSRLN